MKRFILLLFLIAGLETYAQTNPPYYDDIQAFKKQDQSKFPSKKKILFVGSSSFTMWKDVASYFPKHTIINRGFGGSTLPDVIRYKEDIIYPYKPKQVVIYCGENDFATDDTTSAETVFERFRQLHDDIRKRLPHAKLCFISIKPSPSRAHLLIKFQEANALIKQFLSDKEQDCYIDIYESMLMADGRPDPSLYLSDSLHMTAKGYTIWQKAIEPKLINK